MAEAFKYRDMRTSASALIVTFVLLALLYWEPWKFFTNNGTIYVLICEEQYESSSVWDYKKKSTLFENEKKCRSSQLSAIKLNYKIFPEVQKVVFSGKEIGVLSYACDIYDRQNFICPDEDIGVENGKVQLYFNSYETAVSKWRYLIVKFRLFLDYRLNNESIYVFN